MIQQTSRRDFLKRSTLAGTAWWTATQSAFSESKSPNEKLNIACIGVANKGGHNIAQLKSQNIVALCDVDTNYLDKAGKLYPQATRHRDYRVMLEKHAGNFDAVVVSTADHNHAPATIRALSLGKHVYCEKPLTHTVTEARKIAELAGKKKGVATQMGIQIHARGNYRRVVEAIQSGAIGTVTEVYNWCNKGWSNGRFTTTDKPSPANLDWDLWLGPAKERPYSPKIHPANWRRFWEYGSGTFGDMACHIMDLPFWALDLNYPTSVSVTGPEVHPDGAPSSCKADYEFPSVGDRPALEFHWSDGGAHYDLVKNTNDYKGRSLSNWGLGVLFVGDKGMLAADYGRYQLYPREKFADFQPPKKSIPDSIGHWNEWVHACKTGSPTTCNFGYSGRLTETVLLGVVAFRTGKKLTWDAAKLNATNAPEADEFVAKEYRSGWEV
jgi:predicted dehydrogenase